MKTKFPVHFIVIACLLAAVPDTARALTATWNSATDVPVTASSYTASGTVTFTLNFAPSTGTNLTVVKNTGLGFISGAFSNLTQGQAVALTFGGTTYNFIANYYGGTGNDLVLQWANTRLMAWGQNGFGQVGGSPGNSTAPGAVNMTGALSGKTVMAVSAGKFHSLALCFDGTLAAWGSNTNGQLGDGSTTNNSVPVAVNTFGALAGKKVVAISAGDSHNLALCSDGTVFAWGNNSNGQLGDATIVNSSVPVAVNIASSALNGKVVVAVAAGRLHSLALCSDGKVAAWGAGGDDQIGSGSLVETHVPLFVSTTSGGLFGKSVVAISAGDSHSLALCSDGTLVAWGINGEGQLGYDNSAYTHFPQVVDTTGVLSGKTVVAVTAGQTHSLVRCSDNTLSAWGYNYYGQVGNGSTTNSPVPALVNSLGVLSGKTITAVVAGERHSLAMCSDGTIAIWGYDTTTNILVPAVLSTANLAVGERFMTVTSGPSASHSFTVVASPPLAPPAVTTLAATSVTGTSATVNGTVNANGNTTSASFDYGTSTSYGTNVGSFPPSVTGSSDDSVFAFLTGLTPGTTYHFRAKGVSSGGTTNGGDLTFTTAATNNANLSNLALSVGTLSPVFSSSTISYSASVSNATTAITVTPTLAASLATVSVNGIPAASGSPSGPINLNVGNNTITTFVTAQDGVTTKTYSVVVTRASAGGGNLAAVFNTSVDVPVTAGSYSASGTASFTLNFAPVTGTNLTVVKNTGLGFINGTFSNLAQGQVVALTYGGVTYNFVANYYGGTGNDLVLQWANVRLMAWGGNAAGQLGNGSSTDSFAPVAVSSSGVISGKTIVAAAGSGVLGHSVALCSDGTLASWGLNDAGQLGNSTTSSSSVPVLVNTAGALSGKTVIAVAAGTKHCLALCSDGTVAAWGYNADGELGDGSTTNRLIPVAVNNVGALSGKTVIALGAGAQHSLALCSDGTLASWGWNHFGQLGNSSTTNSSLPVAVSTLGVLSGKTVSAISAGGYHSLALCSDGTLEHFK